jgi:hypothetical protein
MLTATNMQVLSEHSSSLQSDALSSLKSCNSVVNKHNYCIIFFYPSGGSYTFDT